jgi:uncharacterized membrane protein YdjX (TVP38/TMEM64 family)
MPAERSSRLRRKLLLFGLSILVLLLLALFWNWNRLGAGAGLEQVVDFIRRVGSGYGPLVAIAGFALASIVAVPLIFLTIVSIVALGPILGTITTLVGGGLGSLASFAIGRRLGAEAIRHLAGERVNAISERLGRSGILTAAALRLVPVAPFAVVNMIAGTSHIRLRDFLVGSTLGMTPGTLIMALLVDQLSEAIRNPGPASLLLAALTLLLIIVGTWLTKAWLAKLDGPDQH